MANKNPWLGLASYEEPKNNNSDYQFCGRDEETLEVLRLIDNNLFVTLYGSSGIGKTSLLKTGVIPILRKRDYFPVYIRLSQEPTELSYAEAIIKRLIDSGLREERSVKLEHPDGNDRLYLWNYFATTRWINADGNEVYPVMILDQFEEVFRDADKKKAELLLKQMYLLLNDELEMPDEEGYSADTNYRFVASIREDFLFVLEDSIDAFGLDLYKSNRYRLRAMKPENARQVVLVPGRDCIAEPEKEKVADRILKLAKKPQSDDIDTLLLSLVCAGTFDKKIGDKITLGDLSVWKDNPMQVYYQDAMKTLNANQIRYIQQNLIREDGSRRRVDVKDLKEALGDVDIRELVEGKNRLFSIGDKGQVELLHDKLAMAVYEERKAFEESERKKKFRRRISVVGVVVIAIAVVFFFQNRKLNKKDWKMMENQSRFVAEMANKLIDEGDSYFAQRLLLYVLPDNLEHPNRPYTFEAESALKYANSRNTAIMRGHECFINSIQFSHDGNSIVSASKDHTIMVWDTKTGVSKTIIGHSDGVKSASFSPDDKNIVSTSLDRTIKIWNAENGELLKTIDGLEYVNNQVVYSPDGKTIAAASYDGIYLYDAEDGKLIKTLRGHKYWVNSICYNKEGNNIISASFDGTVKIWDAESGDLIKTLKGHKYGVVYVCCSPDGECIISSSYDGINIWDAESGELIRTLNGHKYWVNSVCCTHNGERIMSASYDGIRIWDAKAGYLIKTLSGADYWINGIDCSSDGELLVFASFSYDLPLSNDVSVRIVNQNFNEENSDEIIENKLDNFLKSDIRLFQELIDQTRERFKNRPLTEEEKKMYYLE